MRRALVALALSLWTACYVEARATVPPIIHDECLAADEPYGPCELHYVWVDQSYWYRGRWYGGGYRLRPGHRPVRIHIVRPRHRDHRAPRAPHH